MRTYKITHEPTLKFTETYQECNVMVLEVPCSNFVYSKTIHVNIWSGENNFESGGKPIKSIAEINWTEGSIETIRKQSADLMNEMMDLLIQANKKELKDLKGMLVYAFDKDGNEAGLGRTITKITIPPQQLVTINNKSYYELNKVVEKMLERK